MQDTDRPNRSSNMEKAEGDRHPARQDPTKNDTERTSDNSTVENSGLSRGSEENPTLPGDEPTLRTEI